MNSTVLHIPRNMYKKVWDHLLPLNMISEEAAFVFAKNESEDGLIDFVANDFFLVPVEGFIFRSFYHIELKDEILAHVIKKAHNLGSCIIELHSHCDLSHTMFSWSDINGFKEFVPHVRWRLKRRPYSAIVVSHGGFDGFVWKNDSINPDRLGKIHVGKRMVIEATGLSSLDFEDFKESV